MSVESYAELVKNGRLREDKLWGVSTNFLTAQAGDDLFIYTGDQNLGIVGYAKILKVNRAKRKFHLAFDLKKCAALLETPVPASLVRKWVSPLRGAVAALTPHLPKLNSLLPWKRRSETKEVQRLSPRGVGAGFGDAAENRKVERAAVQTVTAIYRKTGWKVESVEQERLGFDLLCSKGMRVEKVEVKGVSGGGVSFFITRRERQTAKDKDFVLYVVSNALSKRPTVRTWTGEQVEKAFTFTEVQFQATLRAH